MENKTVSSLFPQLVAASSKVGCHSGCSLPHPNGLHSRFAETSSFNQALILLTFLAKLLERNSSWQLQCLCSLVYQAAAEQNRQAHHFCAAAEKSSKDQAGKREGSQLLKCLLEGKDRKSRGLNWKTGAQLVRTQASYCHTCLLLLGSQAKRKLSFSFSLD